MLSPTGKPISTFNRNNYVELLTLEELLEISTQISSKNTMISKPEKHVTLLYHFWI